jgi:predicted nucleic acid-binding Zn ribbon protein
MFQNMTAAPISDCPHCSKASTLKRLIGRGSGIIFKGSGFYQTDYKSSSTPASAKGDIGSSSSSTASSASTPTPDKKPQAT